MFYRCIWQTTSDRLLTTLVTAIGLGALTVSALGLLAPKLSPNIYGICHIESHHGREHEKNPDSPSLAQSQRVLLHSLTARNAVIGIHVLALNSYWQKNVHEHPEKGAVIRTCLGMFILTGTSVPIVDCIGAFTMALGQHGGNVGKTAAVIHALRTIIWLAGGIWCIMA